MQHVYKPTVSNHFNFQHDLRHNLSIVDQVNPKLIKYVDTIAMQRIMDSALEWFDSWQEWQQRIFIATVVNSLSSAKLKFMKSAFESVYHRDFPSFSVAQDSCFRHGERRDAVLDLSLMHHGLEQINKETTKAGFNQPRPFDKTFTSFERAQWLLDHYVAMIKQRCNMGNISLVDLREWDQDREKVEQNSLQKEREELQVEMPVKGGKKSNNAKEKDVGDGFDRLKNTLKEMKTKQREKFTQFSTAAAGDNEHNETIREVALSLSDFQSEDYFSIASQECMKLRTSRPSKLKNNYLETLYEKRNKAVLPTVKQIYKKNCLWVKQRGLIKAKKESLKEMFIQQFGLILQNLENWGGQDRAEFLVQFVNGQKPDIVRFTASCVRFAFVKAENCEESFGHLPESFWFNVFRRLSLEDIVNIEKVNHQFNHLCNMERMWKILIHELGVGYDINNLIDEVEKVVPNKYEVDWRKTFFILKDYMLYDDGCLDEIMSLPIKKSYYFRKLKKKKPVKDVRSESRQFTSLWKGVFPNRSSVEMKEVKRKIMVEECCDDQTKRLKMNTLWKDLVDEMGASHKITQLSRRIQIKMRCENGDEEEEGVIDWQKAFKVLGEFWGGGAASLDDLLDHSDEESEENGYDDDYEYYDPGESMDVGKYSSDLKSLNMKFEKESTIFDAFRKRQEAEKHQQKLENEKTQKKEEEKAAADSAKEKGGKKAAAMMALNKKPPSGNSGGARGGGASEQAGGGRAGDAGVRFGAVVGGETGDDDDGDDGTVAGGGKSRMKSGGGRVGANENAAKSASSEEKRKSKISGKTDFERKDSLRRSFTRSRGSYSDDDDDDEKNKNHKLLDIKDSSILNEDEKELLEFMRAKEQKEKQKKKIQENDNCLENATKSFDEEAFLEKQFNKQFVVKARSVFCFDAERYDKLLTDQQIDAKGENREHFFVDYHIPGSNLPVRAIAKVLVFESKGLQPVSAVLCQGDRIYSGESGGKIRVRTPYGEERKKMSPPLKGSVLEMTIGADSKCVRLFAVSWDTTVSVWNSLYGTVIELLRGHTNSVTGVSLDDSYIVTCSHDKSIRVWDAKKYHPLRSIYVHEERIQCMCYYRKNIVTAGDDKKVCVTSSETGELLKTMYGHKYNINSLAIRHDLILSGDVAGWLFAWSLKNSNEGPANSVLAHRDSINAIKFLKDRFWTASKDRHIKEWDAATLKCVRIVQGHTKEVSAIDVCHRFLVSAGRDGSTRIWWFDPSQEKEKSSKTRKSFSVPPE